MNYSDLCDDDFLDELDKLLFEEYLKDPSMVLMEMANVLGNDVEIESRLPFSFYFSSKWKVHQQHGIRAKILWNPSRAPADADGYMELHGNYEYISGSHKYRPTAKELRTAREFFQKYKVLFAAVWEGKLNDSTLQDFLRGQIKLRDLLAATFDITETQFFHLNHCKTLEEVEDCVRKCKIFNVND